MSVGGVMMGYIGDKLNIVVVAVINELLNKDGIHMFCYVIDRLYL